MIWTWTKIGACMSEREQTLSQRQKNKHKRTHEFGIAHNTQLKNLLELRRTIDIG